jgi:SAM-dependent methyltransferase
VVSMMSLEKALLYEKYRLPYPAEMVDTVLEHVGVKVDAAVDIGAGTGQLARLFAARCNHIYAVEPDDSMRTVAADMLRDYPNVVVVDGSAENTTLSSESVDLIVIGNAFHRFKQEAVHELLRILKPNGWVAIISYQYTNQAFTDILFGELGKLQGLTSRSATTWHHMSPQSLFGERPILTLRYPQFWRQDWDAFWGAARSGMEAPESGAEFAQFRDINRSVFDTFRVDDSIRIEYETTVLFGQPKL